MKESAIRLDEIRVPRQQVIRGAGLAVAATALSACTSSGTQPAATPTTTAATPPAGATSSQAGPAKVIAKTSDVPVGSGVIIGDTVLTQPTAGVFDGLSAICTHAGCTVSEVAGGTISCPCHGSKFNLDGSVANGPASSPLDKKNITIQGDSIVLG